MGTTRPLPPCLFYTMIAVLIMAPVVHSTSDAADADQTEEIETRISTLEEGITTLKGAVLKVNQENNKMKTLILATLNLALAPEDKCEHTQQIAGIIEGHGSCALMGTATYPAASCSQLHEACQHPSGKYFVIMGGVFTQVYCEMSELGGGWTRFGNGDMDSVWNYQDEDERELRLTIISAEDIKLAKDLKFNTFRVLTDVEFRLQADDSTNPSSVETRSLPWMEPATLTIGNGRDHTHLELTEDG